MNTIMERLQPSLERIAFVFGNKVSLSLIIRAHDKPGCLILGNGPETPDDLIKALEESKAIAAGGEQ